MKALAVTAILLGALSTFVSVAALALVILFVFNLIVSHSPGMHLAQATYWFAIYVAFVVAAAQATVVSAIAYFASR